eukprot:813097_1
MSVVKAMRTVRAYSRTQSSSWVASSPMSSPLHTHSVDEKMSILSCSNANIVLQFITPAALSLQSHHPLVGSAVLKEFARGVYLKTMSADSADEQPLMGMRRRHVSQGERIPTPAFTLLSTCSLPMPPTQSNHKSSLSKQLLIDQSSTRQTNVKPDPTTDPNDHSNPKSCSSEQVTIHACYRWSPCQTVIYGAAVDSTGRHISCDVVEKDYRNRPESRSVIMSKWWETIVQPVINRATHGRRPSETVVNVVLVNLGEVGVKDVEEWESSLIDIGILHSPAHKYSMSRADTQEGLPGIQLRPSATRIHPVDCRLFDRMSLLLGRNRSPLWKQARRTVNSGDAVTHSRHSRARGQFG